MAKYNVDSVVIKSFNYKDADKIYTLFTKDKGKITATAKGVRKITSRRAGSIDTLNYLTVGIVENPSGFKTITEVQLINSFPSLKDSLDKAKLAYYLLELIHRFLPEDEENNQVFNLLVTTLTKLNAPSSLINAKILVNAFEIKFMYLLGYEISLDKCTVSQEDFSLDWEGYSFNITRGGISKYQNDPGGVAISKETAYVLYYINLRNKGKNEDPVLKFTIVDVQKADELIKLFIHEILDETLKTTRVFSSM